MGRVNLRDARADGDHRCTGEGAEGDESAAGASYGRRERRDLA